MIPLLPIEEGAPGAALDLGRLLSSRLLIQAASGGGKSRALRYILEQTHGHVQQIVLDPEGEFASLREKFDFILAGKEGDVPAEPASAALLCRRLVELRASAVIDLYDLSPSDKRKFVRIFLQELMGLPREMWRPLLVVIDEAHVFAPERGSGDAESTDAVIQLCSQGRKRGFAPILATQRLAKVHKDAAGDLLNKMIGLTDQDVDVKRAGEGLGMDARSRVALKRLRPGQFYISGPAFVGADGERITDLQVVLTGAVTTSHPDASAVGAGAYAPPPAPAAIAALLAQLTDLPAQAEAEASTVEQLRRQIAELKARPGGEIQTVEKLVEVRIEVPVVSEEQVSQLQETAAALADHAREITDQVVRLHEAIARVRPPAPAALVYAEPEPKSEIIRERAEKPPTPKTAPPGYMIPAKSSIPAPQQRILDTLASFERLGVKGVDRSNVAVYSDISSKSSAFSAHITRMKDAGLICYPSGGMVALTASGRTKAKSSTPPATRAQLHQAWIQRLPAAQGRIVEQLLTTHPKALTRDELAKRSRQSITSSAFSANISELKSLGLVDYPRPGSVCATTLLFPSGLS